MKNLTLDEVAVSVRCDGDEITAILKAEYAVDGCRVIKTDAKGLASGKWITINGTHVLIGKNGKVIAGANGKFNGIDMSDGARKLQSNRTFIRAVNKYKKLNSAFQKAENDVTWFGKTVKTYKDKYATNLKSYGENDKRTKESKKLLDETLQLHERSIKEHTLLKSQLDKITLKHPYIANYAEVL